VLIKGANSIAVRVNSPGGPAPSLRDIASVGDNDDTSYPGGLVDTESGDRREGPFDAGASPGQKSTGYTVAGEGWYRRHFALSPQDSDALFAVRFDGVYMNSVVYLNGKVLCARPYGYVTFECDLTPLLNFDGTDNVLAVRVSQLGDNSRWYAGAGLYRHVHLAKRPRAHVPLWGIHLQQENIDLEKDTVTLNVSRGRLKKTDGVWSTCCKRP
jgi:beta-galactosidase